jgi:hypothetical protein
VTGTDGDLKNHLRTNIAGHWAIVDLPALPDLNFCIDGVEGWVECKQTTAWSVKFRPIQVPWIHERSVVRGGRVWVAVRRWHRPAGQDELWLVPGRDVLLLAKHGLLLGTTSAGCHVWQGGPRRWNWAEVRAALLGPTH